jgi:uncharacterized protein (TIGR02118 family)
MKTDNTVVKLLALMPRRPGLSVDSFRHHWRHIHADLVKQITAVQRYVQSYPLEALPGTFALPYDGIAEIWYADQDAVARATTDPEYLAGARRDEAAFIDMTRHVRLVTHERVLLPGPAVPSTPPSSVKAVLFMMDSGDGSVAEWGRLRGARRVVESLVVDQTAPPYDRVLEIRWDSKDAFRSDWERGGPELVDGRNCTGVLVKEVQII